LRQREEVQALLRCGRDWSDWSNWSELRDLRNDIAIAGGVIEGNKAAFCAVNAEGSGFACGQIVGTPGWYVDIELRGSSVYLGGTIDAGGTDQDFFIDFHN